MEILRLFQNHRNGALQPKPHQNLDDPRVQRFYQTKFYVKARKFYEENAEKYNSQIRYDKDGKYDPASLYEQLKKRHNIQ